MHAIDFAAAFRKIVRKGGCNYVAVFFLTACLSPAISAPTTAATDIEIAVQLADLLRSARTVIASKQNMINKPSTGDKGLTGAIVTREALAIFHKRSSGPISFDDPNALSDRLLRAQIAAIGEVVDENQSTINRPGIGFKGFVPAVFARLVNERFKDKVGLYAEIKVTAPMELVRNRKARPDHWERENIRNKLMSPDWRKGELFSAVAKKLRRKAFRVLVPEYYGKNCLSCHGGPKGEMDITGYPKEGVKAGSLAGAISITLYRP